MTENDDGARARVQRAACRLSDRPTHEEEEEAEQALLRERIQPKEVGGSEEGTDA